MAVLSSLWLAGCSVFGVRTVEEPRYRELDRVGTIAIRAYPPRIAAVTEAGTDELRARNLGFRRVAGYIFGANQTQAKIAMTAPVAQARDASGQWRIALFMPPATPREALPAPRDPSVRLEALPESVFAVRRFSGTPAASTVSRETARLLRDLQGSRWIVQGAPVAWFYDPPWTLPPLRRNEVAVPVTARP